VYIPLTIDNTKNSRYKLTYTGVNSLEMSTNSNHEGYASYQITITKGSKAPDDGTLVGSGEIIVHWPDGRGRRYRHTGEISDCLVLLERARIKDAIRTGETLDTMVPFELSYLLTEGEFQSGAQPHSFDPYLTVSRIEWRAVINRTFESLK
jgi:hypothetical protein